MTLIYQSELHGGGQGSVEQTYIEVQAFRKLSGVRKNLTSFVCDQGGEGSGIESRVLEAQTTVHTVCGELESLLLNVVLGTM